MITSKTLTFSYNPREDRIMVIINYESIEKRIDFFLTRKLLLQLLEHFDLILINNCNSGELFKKLYKEQQPLEKLQTKEEKANKQDKNKKNDWESKVDSASLSFTRKEPILLDAVNFKTKNNILVLEYISNGKKLAKSEMTMELFQRTLSSMMRVIPFISWGISPNILD